jgi:hypothetical protein
MKAFLAGLVLMVVLGAASWVLYDFAAISSEVGYAKNAAVHVDERG